MPMAPYGHPFVSPPMMTATPPPTTTVSQVQMSAPEPTTVSAPSTTLMAAPEHQEVVPESSTKKLAESRLVYTNNELSIEEWRAQSYQRH